MSGTIWTELDETKMYRAIDLAEVDKLFSAYHQKLLPNGLMVRSHVLSLLDSNLVSPYYKML